MQFRSRCERGGYSKFFRLALGYENLRNYFKTNFTLMQHHKYSLTELENMMPWEKQIYVSMLVQYVKEQNEQMQLLEAQRRSRR